MRIGINLLPLRPGKVGGAETYIRDLLDAILQIDTINEYILFTAGYNHETLLFPYKNCSRVLFYGKSNTSGAAIHCKDKFKDVIQIPHWVSRKLRNVREHLLTRYINDEKIDLWFCPFGKLDPPLLTIPSVITVFDLQHEYFPEHFSNDELRNRKEFYFRSCRDATRIIAISEFTKRTIVEQYGVPSSMITPIWLSASNDFRKFSDNGQLQVIKDKYQVPDRYFIYPANTWYHKNHARLFKAFSIYKKTIEDNSKLILTGTRAEGERTLSRVKTSLGLCDDILALGFVPKDDLPFLYNGAECLVFPSLFEGFGIPLVEAMIMECPIVASDTTSIPEIVKDAGLLFDPMNAENIADAIMNAHNDCDLRNHLVQKGKERARLFSYKKTARQTLKVFEEAASEFFISN